METHTGLIHRTDVGKPRELRPGDVIGWDAASQCFTIGPNLAFNTGAGDRWIESTTIGRDNKAIISVPGNLLSLQVVHNIVVFVARTHNLWCKPLSERSDPNPRFKFIKPTNTRVK